MTKDAFPVWTNEDDDAATRQLLDQTLADLAESSDPSATLRAVFARVWQQGWDLCYEDGGKDWNPYTGQPVQI